MPNHPRRATPSPALPVAGRALLEFLKTWDRLAKEEADRNPFFKKVWDSQRQYASMVVPAKRFMFPPYNFAADYYWPQKTN